MFLFVLNSRLSCFQSKRFEKIVEIFLEYFSSLVFFMSEKYWEYFENKKKILQIWKVSEGF